MKRYRCIVTGLGNIGRNLLEILATRQEVLAEQYAFQLDVVGLADSSGIALNAEGFELAPVIALKAAGHGVAELPAGQPGGDPRTVLDRSHADFLLEATPTNLRDGQPGLDIVRTALRNGLHCVLASKGPLVLGYGELAGMSDLSGVGRPALRFSGAVGGALPSINIGRRDLAAGQITRVEAVLNGTTQVILEMMAEGRAFDAALAAAKAMGIVEPDPSLDVDGWDAANKLVIVANAVLGDPTTLSDVQVLGIREVTPVAAQAAWAAGGRMSVVGVAERLPDATRLARQYRYSVAPTVLPPGHPLSQLGLGEMGIVYWSDIYGRTTAMSLEDGPIGSCAAMLRDVIEIVDRLNAPLAAP